MTNIDKIRAALGICDCGICDEASTALAELERAAAEPLFILTTGAIGSDGEQDDWDIECDSSRRLDAFCAAHPGETVKLYTTPPPAPGMFTAEEMEAAYMEAMLDADSGAADWRGRAEHYWKISSAARLVRERTK